MSLKIMSQNVMCWGVEGKSSLKLRRPLMRRAVTENAPDIVGFQEVTPEWERYFETDIENYKCHLVYRSETNPEAAPIYWNPKRVDILEKGHFWLSDTPNISCLGWDAKCVRITCWCCFKDRYSGSEFVFINTHLDHVGVKARTEGIKQIAKFASDNFSSMPVVLTGDFNDTPDSQTVCTANKFFINASNAAHKPVDMPTYHGLGECKPITIDYIFLSPQIKCLKFDIVDIRDKNIMHSDHYGITAELEI